MNKTVWTFGCIGGFLGIGMMLVSMSMEGKLGCGTTASEVIGYTILVACALFVFFGVKSYRDNLADGQITFGKAFLVGLLISLVASVCYVVGWEIFDHFIKHHSMDGYFAAMEQQARAEHLSPAALQAKLDGIQKFKERYQNLFWNAAFTFIEPFPVLLAMSVISAAILRRKGQAEPAVVAVAS